MKIENDVLIKVEDSDIQAGKFIFPERVTEIGASAFSGREQLTSIAIPDNVTNVWSSAFQNCTGLRSATLPKNLASIPDHMFHNCWKLTSVVIQEGISIIENNAFDDCRRLETIEIPPGIISIGDMAFNFCSRLKSITIPESVTFIGKDAFAYCNDLSEIHIKATNKENYDRIVRLLPPELQEKIQVNNKTFINKALTLLAGSTNDTGFFKKSTIPTGLVFKVLVNLAKEYNMPPFMLNEISKKFGVNEKAVQDAENKTDFSL